MPKLHLIEKKSNTLVQHQISQMDLTAFNNIIASNPVPMAVLDQCMTLITASNQWNDVFYPQHKPLLDTYIEELQNYPRNHWEEVIEESKLLKSEDNEQFIRLEVKLWRSADGKVEGFIIYGEDMSTAPDDSKRLIEHLYQSEMQFNQAFDHSLSGMAIISPDGYWKRINKSLSDILGYTEAEIAGRHVKEFTHQEDIVSNAALLSQLASGQIDKVRVEKRYIHKNGNSIWVIAAATMLTDSNGKPLHFISQIEDITERKEIQERLLESEKKYRTIFENVQDVFYRTDNNGKITEISPYIEKYSGYPREKIINQPVSDFYYFQEDRERITKSLLENGTVEDFEVRLKTSQDEIRYASVNAHIIMEDGLIVGTEGTMRDVTTRRIQERALIELNKELTIANEQKIQLLSIIGHDLRNPISGSLQLLNLILMDLESTAAEDLHLYLSKMKQELANTNDLLEQLLSWAKVQFKSISINPMPIHNLENHIKHFISTIKPFADKKHISVSLTIDDEIILYADLEMLAAILRNLLTNALKFTKEDGTVNISVNDTDDHVLFTVQDNGIGMTPEVMSKLFATNNYTSTYGTAGEKGSGLGLNLSMTFVLKHGGKLWAESKPGEGSTFYFTIPHQNQAEINNENPAPGI